MTIAKRLTILLFIAISSLLAVSIGGNFGMKKVNDGLTYVNQSALPSISVLSVVKDNLLRRRMRTLGHVLTNEASAMAEIEKEIEVIDEKAKKGLKDYEKLVDDAKDRAMWEADKTAYAEYDAIMDQVQALSRNGQKAAAADYLKTNQTKLISITKTIIDHAEYNTAQANSAGKEAQELYSKLSIFMLVLSAVAVALTAVTGFLIYKNIRASLSDLTTTITDIETNLDLTKRATVRSNDEIGMAISSVNRLIQRLHESMRNLISHTEQVSSASGRLANAAHEVSTSSAHQSTAAADMAATVEELTVSINHVADQATEANQLSAESGELAESGEAIIVKTVEDINSIATTVQAASAFVDNLDRDSQRINTVISVIKEVADQTNLLALNAAIEAARAGEQGRGFAVVADEVRKLAERTAQSTQEIAETIASMQINSRSTVEGIQAVEVSVSRGVERAGEASHAISQIGQSSRNAVERVSEISNAIREQGLASTNIAVQLEKIAQMSEENNAAADNTSDTAKELDKLAQEMKQIISQYRI